MMVMMMMMMMMTVKSIVSHTLKSKGQFSLVSNEKQTQVPNVIYLKYRKNYMWPMLKV